MRDISVKKTLHSSSLLLITCRFIFHNQNLIILMIDSMPVLKELSFISIHKVYVYLGHLAKSIWKKNKIYFENVFKEVFCPLSCIPSVRKLILSCLLYSRLAWPLGPCSSQGLGEGVGVGALGTAP